MCLLMSDSDNAFRSLLLKPPGLAERCCEEAPLASLALADDAFDCAERCPLGFSRAVSSDATLSMLSRGAAVALPPIRDCVGVMLLVLWAPLTGPASGDGDLGRVADEIDTDTVAGLRVALLVATLVCGDASAVGVGARSLAVGEADRPASVLPKPAGLADIEDWESVRDREEDVEGDGLCPAGLPKRCGAKEEAAF